MDTEREGDVVEGDGNEGRLYSGDRRVCGNKLFGHFERYDFYFI